MGSQKGQIPEPKSKLDALFSLEQAGFKVFHAAPTHNRDNNCLGYDFLTPIKKSVRRYSEDSLGLNST